MRWDGNRYLVKGVGEREGSMTWARGTQVHRKTDEQCKREKKKKHNTFGRKIDQLIGYMNAVEMK